MGKFGISRREKILDNKDYRLVKVLVRSVLLRYSEIVAELFEY